MAYACEAPVLCYNFYKTDDACRRAGGANGMTKERLGRERAIAGEAGPGRKARRALSVGLALRGVLCVHFRGSVRVGRYMGGRPIQKDQPDRIRKSAGFTLIEVMVVIGIIAIATAVAVPSLSTWVVNERIRNAAGNLQEDIQWGRGYAVKTDQDINLTIQNAVATNGVTVCTWSFTSVLNNAGIANAAISNAPSMNAQTFANEYPNTACQINALSPVTFTPQGTITSGGAGQLQNGFYQINSSTNAAHYATWLIVFYGAGEIRSCIPPSNTPPVTLANDIATGASPCVNQ